MQPCRRCGGSGTEPDDRAIGAEMREKRRAAGLSLRDAAKRMGLSASYLSDLERGNRHWRADLVQRAGGDE